MYALMDIKCSKNCIYELFYKVKTVNHIKLYTILNLRQIIVNEKFVNFEHISAHAFNSTY